MKPRRSVEDWLAHAATAKDPTELDACVAGALERARYAGDYKSVLLALAKHPHATPARLREVAELTLARAAKEPAVWNYREAATVLATKLGDAAGARAALERGFEDLKKRAPLPAYTHEWVLLAEGFFETLRDSEGGRRCLEMARARALDPELPEDPSFVATAWATYVDRDEARALVAEAEAMLGKRQGAQAWSVANVWRDFGEPEAARRVLDGALSRAKSSADATQVAHAWASHDDLGKAREAIEKARTLARDAADWLGVADDVRALDLGEELLREALAKAEARSEGDAVMRMRIAAAYERWLGDSKASARVGPRGLRPDALRVKQRELTGWDASGTELLDWLRERVTAASIESIAEADYGHEAAANAAAIRDICATGVVPRHLDWIPREVCELTRWREGESVDHVGRALACAILVLVPDASMDPVTNTIILAESCVALGPEAARKAEKLFAFLAETDAIGPGSAAPDEVEYAAPLAVLLVTRASTAPDDPRLEGLARELSLAPACADGTLRSYIKESVRKKLWHELLDEALGPLRATCPSVATVLRQLGRK